ncbi:MAG TPA: LuxR C-terminal-related transcriptional regulator [Polyangia bacterium]|jgi:DNA-binding NarL/FixJ family response regulator|nr:LuxR C-terminal-related transcriptional regulator [Polyangia bacterium]
MATHALALIEEERLRPTDGIVPGLDQPELATGGGWSGDGTGEAGPPLSRREREILELVEAGKTRKEVAFDLGVTHSTVRVLYSRAMKKLGRHWRPAVTRRDVTTGA